MGYAPRFSAFFAAWSFFRFEGESAPTPRIEPVEITAATQRVLRERQPLGNSESRSGDELWA